MPLDNRSPRALTLAHVREPPLGSLTVSQKGGALAFIERLPLGRVSAHAVPVYTSRSAFSGARSSPSRLGAQAAVQRVTNLKPTAQ